MDRRTFLTSWRSSGSRFDNNFTPLERSLTTGLEPYVPSVSAPWDEIRAGHLLRRTMMSPKWADMITLLDKTPSQAVDILLNTPSNPMKPAVADHDTESRAGLDAVLVNQLIGTWGGDATQLREWWAGVLLNSPLSIIEKMTFFWSGHFTTQFNVDNVDYVQAPLLYRQNNLLRSLALGNIRDLTFAITLDPAMLVFLGGDVNNKVHPNENYSREVMELFTMGLGQYSEGDVKEAARILTGWHASRYNDEPAQNGLFNAFFDPNAHDTGAKQYLGVTFSATPADENTEFLVKKNEVGKMIDTIFEQRKQAVATFICRKIYRFFVYSSPGGTDETVIAAMAQIFMDNDFTVGPVISKLLKSAHFFDNANIGAQIKTPAEFVIGLGRQLGYAANVTSNMSSMLQTVFNPPNVSGWTGWHDWITTNTFPVRASIAATAITALSDQQALTFIGQFPNNNDADKLIDAIGALMLPRRLSKQRHDDLVSRIVGGGKSYEWNAILTTSPATAARNLRDMLTTLTSLPDFQLC